MESSVAKDKIVAQNPLRGAKVNRGTNVSVILSEGPPRNITLSQTVDLPNEISSSLKFEVIIDGEIDESYTKSIVPKYSRQYTLTVSRMSTVGAIQVVVALNDQTYRVYKFDFENSTVSTLESYTFYIDTDTETETDTDTDTEATDTDTENESEYDSDEENIDSESANISSEEEVTSSEYVEDDEPVVSEPDYSGDGSQEEEEEQW